MWLGVIQEGLPLLQFFIQAFGYTYSKQNDKIKTTPIYNAYQVLNPKFILGSFKQILTEQIGNPVHI